jgi:biotin carboxylase
MQKKILFLGGSFYQLAPIKYAKRQGHYTITCDYLPENPGHSLADEYYNISTTDKEAVLDLAKKLNIDGILAFASDPSAPTAAYVAEKLNLPGNPYQSTLILSRKDLFRKFLKEHHFNVPVFESFTSVNDAKAFFEALEKPVMVKPVDSSGSKGVSKVCLVEEIDEAFKYALAYSGIGKVIIEEFIPKKDFQIAGDGFIYNGELVFRCFAQEHFNNEGNPFVPIGESFPLLISEHLQVKVHHEIQRLLTILGMRAGALNFDIIFDKEDNLYLIEIGARGGGNLISEVINYSTGIDLSKFSVDAALNIDCSALGLYEHAKYCSCYMIHTQQPGIFQGVELDPIISNNLLEKHIFVKEGATVRSFQGSNDALGCLILRYDFPEEMLGKMASMNKYVKIRIT